MPHLVKSVNALTVARATNLKSIEDEGRLAVAGQLATDGAPLSSGCGGLVRLTLLTWRVTIVSVIRSFRSRETERVWRGERSRRLPTDIQQVARRKLRMLNNAQILRDLRVPPNNRLKALRGDRAGQHSIRINDQWRICFRWQDGDAHDVEIVDYH